MRSILSLRNLMSASMLRLLPAIVLCAAFFESRLFSQDPLRASRPQIEPQSLRSPDPDGEEPKADFTPVDPESAAIPKQWFKHVPVAPGGLGIQADDVPLYFRILDHVRHVPSEKLVAADREFRLEMIEKYGKRKRGEIRNEVKDESLRERVLHELDDRLRQYREEPFSYPLVRDAFNRAKECQGEVVSFSGHARRPRSFPAGENDYGFDALYEVWLFDEDANHYPVVVVCSELPDDMPVNVPDTEVLDGVSVRGYFFKLYAYEGEEQPHVIPMILADTVEWDPPEAVSRSVPGWAYGLAIVLGVVALWLIVRSGRTDKKFQSVRDKLSEPNDNPFQPPE